MLHTCIPILESSCISSRWVLFFKRFIIFGILLLLLFVVDSSNVNVKVNDDLKVKSPIISNNNGTVSSNEQLGGARFGSDSIIVTQVKKEEQLGDSKGFVEKDLDRSNSSESLLSKEGDDQKIIDGSSNDELKDEGEVFDSKSESKKDGIEESNGSLVGIKKEKLCDEECDPSNMCVDKKKNITACLRVPGNDSPDLSLLIQNKGSGPVTITITAPEYVQLEETKVHLQQKEDKKVKVTVGYEALDSLILLAIEDNRCTLDFKGLIPRDSRIEMRFVFKLRFFSNLTRTQCMIVLTLSAVFLFGSAWMCLGMYTKLYQGNGYQSIDTELPLTATKVSIKGAEANVGWDEKWDDHWDDEEAPKTPVLPATPNLSSRRLASRRLSKEGWKD